MKCEEGGWYGGGKLSSMSGGGEQIVYIVEISREAEVEEGALEQQIATSTRLEH